MDPAPVPVPEPVTRAPATPEPEVEAMPLVDHLAELRRRIAISVVAVLLGAIIGFIIGIIRR